jgi:hypothetical protein
MCTVSRVHYPALCVRYEGAGLGMTWSTLYQDPFSFGLVLFFLLLDTALYMFVAWFLEQVLPTEYGAHQPVYFLCTTSFWRRTCCSDVEVEARARLPIGNEMKVFQLGNAVNGEDMFEEPVEPALRGKELVQVVVDRCTWPEFISGEPHIYGHHLTRCGTSARSFPVDSVRPKQSSWPYTTSPLTCTRGKSSHSSAITELENLQLCPC